MAEAIWWRGEAVWRGEAMWRRVRPLKGEAVWRVRPCEGARPCGG